MASVESQESSAIVQQMSKDTATKLAAEVGSVYGEYAGKHASKIAAIPGEITKEAMKVFNEKKMSLGDIMKEITTPSEEQLEKNSEAEEKKAQSKFISDAKETMSNVKNKIDEVQKVANEKIPMVLSYIDNGPKWVQNQLDKQVKEFAKNIKTDLDDQWKEDEKKYNGFIETSAQKIGGKMANKFNDKLRKQADKQQKNVEKVKAKAMTKLKTVAQKAKVLIAAKTGIYIPV